MTANDQNPRRRASLELLRAEASDELAVLIHERLRGGDRRQSGLIPIQCEYYALEGLSQLLGSVQMIQKHLNPSLHVSTILLTMYDGRTRLAQQVADEVREHFSDEVLKTVIPRSVRVSEAPSFGQTVIAYDGHSAGAIAYREAAVEIVGRDTTTKED